MNDNLLDAPPGEFVLFRNEDGQTHVECLFESYTLWLSQSSIAELYGKDVRTINEHLVNIFSEINLLKNSLNTGNGISNMFTGFVLKI